MVTITLPVHPLAGLRLTTHGEVLGDNGRRRYVIIEHPTGVHLRVPVDWTDLVVSRAPPVIAGRPVRYVAEDALRLARAVTNSLDAARSTPAGSRVSALPEVHPDGRTRTAELPAALDALAVAGGAGAGGVRGGVGEPHPQAASGVREGGCCRGAPQIRLPARSPRTPDAATRQGSTVTNLLAVA